MAEERCQFDRCRQYLRFHHQQLDDQQCGDSQRRVLFGGRASNVAGVVTSSNALLTTVSSKPVIVLQPSSQSVLPGQPVYFSVGAIGNPSFFYSWQFNGKNLANVAPFGGVTTSNLVISNASSTNA